MWINPLHIVIHSACALMALSFSCSNYALCLFSILQVFLTKHYRNRRSDDPDFFLDFEEIYVIDSKTRSITRAKVVVRYSNIVSSKYLFSHISFHDLCSEEFWSNSQSVICSLRKFHMAPSTKIQKTYFLSNLITNIHASMTG